MHQGSLCKGYVVKPCRLTLVVFEGLICWDEGEHATLRSSTSSLPCAGEGWIRRTRQDRPRVLTGWRLVRTPSLTRDKTKAPPKSVTSHSLTTKRGRCAVQPTGLGPAWACVIRAVSIVKFTIMTACGGRRPWEYSSDKPGTRGSKCLWQRQAAPRVPINTPVLCPARGG
jgi:hypothetical protein